MNLSEWGQHLIQKKFVFFRLGVKSSETMNTDKPHRPSISIDAELFQLALRRMEQRRIKMFSRYVQELIKDDTACLLQKHQEPPFLMAAEETPKYGEKVNETAAPARLSKVSYRRGKTKGQ
jgi:hypothetical protein